MYCDTEKLDIQDVDESRGSKTWTSDNCAKKGGIGWKIQTRKGVYKQEYCAYYGTKFRNDDSKKDIAVAWLQFLPMGTLHFISSLQIT